MSRLLPPAASASPRVEVSRFASRAELNTALVERLERVLTRENPAGPSALMLSGGSTPDAAYALIAGRAPRASSTIRVLYSDERHVPITSAASNYHLTLPMLSAIGIPLDRVVRVRTLLPLPQAAADYGRRLAELTLTGVTIGTGLLGLGADGHTASLFSVADLERSRGHLAVAVQRPDGRGGISVTPDVLAQVGSLVFLVAGADKRAVLARFLAHDPELTAWRAIAGCARVEVWTEPEALPTA